MLSLMRNIPSTASPSSLTTDSISLADILPTYQLHQQLKIREVSEMDNWITLYLIAFDHT